MELFQHTKIPYNTGMDLSPRITPNAQVIKTSEKHWQLTTPPGPAGVYRWAQLDDYMHRSRKDFLWQAPLSFSLEARISDPNHQGTWGFGLWNDPFNASLGLGGAARRLPSLPNASWFFYASPPNHLSLHDHPADGLLAATFRSPRLPSVLLAPGFIFAPLLFIRPAARLLRKFAGLVIRDEGTQLSLDVTSWHTYRLEWLPNKVNFFVDDSQAASLGSAPQGKLGFVLWVDNQYAAFSPNGQLKFGTLPNGTETKLEVKNLIGSPL